MAYQSINPNDGTLLGSFEHMRNARLDDALAAAEAVARGAVSPKVAA